MTKSYLFIAGFRDLFGFERAVNDGDYRNRVAEVTEQGKKIRAIWSLPGNLNRLRGRPWVAALERLGSHFQDLLWTGIVKSKIE